MYRLYNINNLYYIIKRTLFRFASGTEIFVGKRRPNIIANPIDL